MIVKSTSFSALCVFFPETFIGSKVTPPPHLVADSGSEKVVLPKPYKMSSLHFPETWLQSFGFHFRENVELKVIMLLIILLITNPNLFTLFDKVIAYHW